ncbi:MAG: UDP-2,3-diacylglucosamine diphosphatase LpxI [Phycisphaeraceae bacterium]|nr:UDP-2,3-diacylglucosamine diphosphatase LpxI [Phycisphaeraceae bacterium]MCW5754037.1 UDP-2,3-diacylglucosamine diphosphatase LpxI [Phycisphaeraceae bacterium]
MAGTLTILPDPPKPPTPVGLIAGGGRLPILVARGLRDAGHPVHGVGLHQQYDSELPSLCTTFRDVGLLRVGSWARALRRRNVNHAIMVGKVDKAKIMHDPLRIVRNLPDLRTLRAWLRLRHDRRSHAVLAAIAEELERSGVSLMDSTAPIRDQLAHAGTITKTRPTPQQRADIEFVWPVLSDLLRLDVGQAIAVRDRDTISVEAVEGTDAMIERTGRLCRAKGWTLCKGSRAGHDRRSDVPTVGEHTIRKLYENGGRCLALAADDVIMIDKKRMVTVADELGVAIVGIPMAGA